MRPEATAEKRLRGGSRPGLVKSFADQISGTFAPIRMLTVMRSLNDEGRAILNEDFSDLTIWEAPSWFPGDFKLAFHDAGESFVFNTVIDGVGPYLGGVLKTASIPALNASAGYTLSAQVVPRGTENALAYELFVGMDDDSPDVNLSGLTARLSFFRGLPGRVHLQLEQDGGFRASAFQDVGVWPNDVTDQWFSIRVHPNKVIELFWADATTPKLTHQLSAFNPPGNNVGFSMRSINTDLVLRINDLILDYFSTAAGVPPEAVIASANGELWRESAEGKMTKIINDNGLTLASDRPVQAVDRLGKLYIADSSDTRLAATDGSGVIVNGVLDAGISGWDTHGILTDDDVVELTSIVNGTSDLDTTGNVTARVFSVASISPADGLSLEVLNGSAVNGNCDSCNFRIARGAKVYNSNTDTLTHWKATAGLVPVGCPIIDIFRDRLVLGGIPESSGIWFMSKFGDPDDFDYSQPDTNRTRAIASNTTTSDAGGLSIPMSAIAAITEDYLVISAESEMYLLRGDPTLGGILANVSSQIGIGSRTAHCRTPDGSLIFLSRDGLYRFHPSNPFLENISRDRLPIELIDVVQNTSLTVALEYDVRFRGVHIYITPNTAGATTHYWFDWDTQSFWTVRLGNRLHEPFAVNYDAKKNRTMLGGRDGYIRHYDSAVTDDDGTTINSNVLYGPFSLGGNTGEGSVSDLYMTLDDASGDVEVDTFVGDDPESAFKSASRASHTVSAGYSKRLPVRARGSSAFVKISSSSGSQWAIDSLSLVTQQHGRHRG